MELQEFIAREKIKGDKNMADSEKPKRHGHPMFYELLEQMADLAEEVGGNK